MKRAGNLYAGIYGYENLALAFMKAARGKQFRPDVWAFKANLDKNLTHLSMTLKHHNPDIGHYRFFKIRDPKPREICAASFPERVLHHAIMNVCEPALESYAIHDSYACRKGRGNKKALERARCFANRFSWYLKLDIAKYFDTIDHGILKSALARRFKDKALLALFENIIHSYHKRPGKGLPIGNLISQHLANFYLGHFDHWIKETMKVRGYLRYMDDSLVFSDEKKELVLLAERIKQFLKVELALDLKGAGQLNRCRQGIPFLGYRVFPWGFRLTAAAKKRFERKFKGYEGRYLTGEWSMADLVRHVEPLVAVTRGAGARGFRQKIISDFGMVS